MQKNSAVLTWQIALTYVGTIIGAGFASGQEIASFFTPFGWKGLYGTILAGLLFAALGGSIVHTAGIKKTKNYRQFIKGIFGEKLVRIVDVFLLFFLWGGLVVMLVAGGSLYAKMLSSPLGVGFLFTAIVVYVSLLMGLDGILWLNTALVPGMILLCGGIAGLSIFNTNPAHSSASPEIMLVAENWFFASLLYVAYNSVLGAVVLASLGDRPNGPCKKGAFIGGLFLGILATIICLALLVQGEQITNEELPMLALALKINPLIGWFYSLILWVAILTTALSNGFGLLRRLEEIAIIPRPLLAVLLLIPAAPFVGWPFPGIIRTVYPLLGYGGLLLMAVVFLKAIADQLKHRIWS